MIEESPLLFGSKVVLRAPHDADAELRRKQGVYPEIRHPHQSPEVTCREMTTKEADAWLHKIRMRQPQAWVICGDGYPIGTVTLYPMQMEHLGARLSIGLFSPDNFGKGYGTDATRAVLAHAFEDLRLRRVDLKVLAGNERAIAMYLRAGFVAEGRHRDSHFLGGRWHDSLTMAVIRSDA